MDSVESQLPRIDSIFIQMGGPQAHDNSRKCQTATATPAEAGDLPFGIEIGEVTTGTGCMRDRLESVWFRSMTMSSDRTVDLCMSLLFRCSTIASGQQIIHNEVFIPLTRADRTNLARG
jgi:hypothetical protein